MADARTPQDAQSVIRDLKLLSQHACDEDEVDILRRAVELIRQLEDELAYSGVSPHRQLRTIASDDCT